MKIKQIEIYTKETKIYSAWTDEIRIIEFFERDDGALVLLLGHPRATNADKVDKDKRYIERVFRNNENYCVEYNEN